MMGDRWRTRGSQWGRRLLAIGLILALIPACSPAQVYIPLAYAFTGMCVALLMSPTLTAAVVGLVVGGLLGAAVYNNSLKHQIQDRHRVSRSHSREPGSGNIPAASCQNKGGRSGSCLYPPILTRAVAHAWLIRKG